MSHIFVFGSNLLGIHKRGSALYALNNHGAIFGQGVGLQGSSYAIPTKSSPYTSLDLVQINKFIADFLTYAYFSPENTYHVTNIGCGLAGWLPSQIAPMFNMATRLDNVKITREFADNSAVLKEYTDVFSEKIIEFPGF